MSFFGLIRKVIFSLIVLAIVSYGWGLYAQQQPRGLTPPPKPTGTNSAEAPAGPAPSDGAPFVVGERLAFNVSWSTFPTAARIEMEVADRGLFFGHESYQIRAKVETLGEIRSLFGDLDQQYNSYVNLKTGLPHRLVASVRQGQTQVEQITTFDQPKKQATFSDESSVTLPGDTYDIASLIYGLRLRGVAEGQHMTLTAIYGKELIEVDAEVKGRERIQTQAGAYSTLCVKLTPKGKLSKYKARVWLSDDAQRLPVLVIAKLPFGEPRAELASVSVSIRPTAPLARMDLPNDESGSFSAPLPPGGRGVVPPNGAAGLAPNSTGTAITPDPKEPKEKTPERNLPFIVGERLIYDIAWGNFASVGKASFEVRRQGMLGQTRVFEFFGEASNTGVARSLITVSDQMSSYVSVDSLIPVRTDIRLREGKRFKQTTANYDWNSNKALLSSGTQTDLQPGTLDLLSLFYFVRAADLKIGAAFNSVFLDANHRPQMVVVRVAKQETINSAIGSKDALQLDILAPDPAKLLLAQVWISNDARRLPLYLVTRTRFGEIRFQLSNAINTK
ncbi:MAG: DUF3108 domain-containing protein [Blastocatellia bacterium]|nr:DUF3108 domain-containing protein [Blastocatellia bacterium]